MTCLEVPSQLCLNITVLSISVPISHVENIAFSFVLYSHFRKSLISSVESNIRPFILDFISRQRQDFVSVFLRYNLSQVGIPKMPIIIEGHYNYLI